MKKQKKEKASIRRILFQEDMPSEQSTEEEKEKSIKDLSDELDNMLRENELTTEQIKQMEDAEEAYSTESLLYNNLARRALQLDTYSLEEKKAHARDLCAFIKAHQSSDLGALAVSLRRAIINQFREKQYIPNPHAPVGGMGSTMIKLVPDRLPTKN